MNLTTLQLYSDADAQVERFAVTYDDGSPLVYGNFFPNDWFFNPARPRSAGWAAARCAIYHASRIGKLADARVFLDLIVSDEWLASAKVFGSVTHQFDVSLRVNLVPRGKNKADDFLNVGDWMNADHEAGVSRLRNADQEELRAFPRQVSAGNRNRNRNRNRFDPYDSGAAECVVDALKF